MSGDQHPFVVWVREHHGKDDNPLGDFARELDRSWEVPTSGDGDKLREALEDSGVDEWILNCFDVAWHRYQPTCEWPGCSQPKELPASYCGEHLEELL